MQRPALPMLTSRRQWIAWAGASATAAIARPVEAQLPATNRRVAITIDDGPVVNEMKDLANFQRISAGLLESVQSEKVYASRKSRPNPSALVRVRDPDRYPAFFDDIGVTRRRTKHRILVSVISSAARPGIGRARASPQHAATGRQNNGPRRGGFAARPISDGLRISQRSWRTPGPRGSSPLVRTCRRSRRRGRQHRAGPYLS